METGFNPGSRFMPAGSDSAVRVSVNAGQQFRSTGQQVISGQLSSGPGQLSHQFRDGSGIDSVQLGSTQ
ncbi:hypothetical protein HanRHA438_Chr02g0063271 [Helianthus annuus]|nr:hypothetical protein HanRHA438_Chr02g0063271 [Helianthus annuus]